MKKLDFIMVNCWVPPKHSPKSRYQLGRRRATHTETRMLSNQDQVIDFLNNLENAGQLEKLRGVLIMPKSLSINPSTAALSTGQFTDEARDTTKDYRRDVW